MRVGEFWQVVAAADEHARDHGTTPAEGLRAQLAPLPTGAVRRFHRHVERFAARAATSELSAAALLLDGDSDDGFLDLCTWLVSRGRETYAAVLADPDRLADVQDLDDQLEHAEEWSYVAEEVLDGRDADLGDEPDLGPGAEPLTDEQVAALPSRFPRLWARYGRGVDDEPPAGPAVRAVPVAEASARPGPAAGTVPDLTMAPRRRMTISPFGVPDGSTVPGVRFEQPPEDADIEYLRARGVRAAWLESTCWDRAHRGLDWLVDLAPLVLVVTARGTVPHLPAEALTHVQRLSVHPTQRLSAPLDPSTLTSLRGLAAARRHLDGPLTALTRLEALTLEQAPIPSLEEVAGLPHLRDLTLWLDRAAAEEPFSFAGADRLPALRQLAVMECAIGPLEGVQRLASLERLLLSARHPRRFDVPVDLAPLAQLPRLCDVRIVTNAPCVNADVLDALPALDAAVVGKLEVRR
ncbi:DUF4240 domain-containing protein [Cellulomonas sp. 179-A 9B4 NHS]|uniref:DUF4240 domain-containing protein n=1 Tax=Cellulomonas sp. 179-A 9B4 NHS TaxID=3142379 RepID=UPI00399F48FA